MSAYLSVRLRVAIALATVLLAGCAATEYYAQAISGHMELMGRAVPIGDYLERPEVPTALRDKLQRVLQIRDFASSELKLPDNGSYRRYADLQRPYALWNVFATPEFSLRPLESCFPIAGCVSYRGYYREADARAYAAEQRALGYDVHVGGVPAYSTLGWFDDPILSTFIRYPDAELARLLFHELAHQVAYAKDDTVFNESFAVAVEEEGTRRWLAAYATPGESEAYAALQKRRREFVQLIQDHRAQLAEFYAQNLAPEEKRRGKAQRYAELMNDYARLKVGWGGFAGFDRMFADGPNNALLASVSAYSELVPALRALLAQKNGDLAAFYREAQDLARMDKTARTQRLAGLQ